MDQQLLQLASNHPCWTAWLIFLFMFDSLCDKVRIKAQSKTIEAQAEHITILERSK